VWLAIAEIIASCARECRRASYLFRYVPRVLVVRVARATYNEEKSCINPRLTNYVFDS
jgi:hypothetical protein